MFLTLTQYILYLDIHQNLYFTARLLDGCPGFVIAMGQSYRAFYRYANFMRNKIKLETLETVDSSLG